MPREFSIVFCPSNPSTHTAQCLVLPGLDSYNFFHTRDIVSLLCGKLIVFSVAAVCIRRGGGPLFRGLLTRPKDLLRFQVTSSFPGVNVEKIRESNCAENLQSFGSFLEMEVTEIILAKVLRLCQLSSHSRGFLSRFFNP